MAASTFHTVAHAESFMMCSASSPAGTGTGITMLAVFVAALEASKVRRALRFGAHPPVNDAKPGVDLDAILAGLTPEQRTLLATKINAPTGPTTGPKKNRRDPFGSRRLELMGL